MDAEVSTTNAETTRSRHFRGRPVGIVALVAIQLAHVIAIAFSIELPTAVRFEPLQPIEVLAPLSPAVPFIALAGLIIAAGLWWLRRWAWYVMMLWVGVSMVGGLIAYFEDEPAYSVMVISVAAVFYLNQWEVRSAFRATRGEEVRV